MLRPMLPMTGFYQFGYVTRDLDAAKQALRDHFGVVSTRYRKSSEWMETLHAWTGASMIEVIAVGEGAPPLYTDYVPDEPGKLVLHHLGRRIDSVEQWDAMETAVGSLGLDKPMHGAVMDGDLRFAYVDTRALLGIYTEYVYLMGEALKIYDDVPRNG